MMRANERRHQARRWEDEPWTRGEQAAFSTELARQMGALRAAVTRGAALVAIAAWAAPLILGAIALLRSTGGT